MKRYNVPRVCFINKMDRYVELLVFIIVADLQKADMSSYISHFPLRAGSNPFRVINQLRTKLRMNAAAVQVPIGAEDNLRGVVDLVRMKAIYKEGVKG